jgi:hypothetical protein
MSENRKTHLHNVAMFPLGITILLMSMRTRHLLSNANVVKEGIKFFILSAPIRLNRKNLVIKLALNKALKLKEVFENLIFRAKQIKPGKLLVDMT